MNRHAWTLAVATWLFGVAAARAELWSGDYDGAAAAEQLAEAAPQGGLPAADEADQPWPSWDAAGAEPASY
jgi:hypothetical protein